MLGQTSHSLTQSWTRATTFFFKEAFMEDHLNLYLVWPFIFSLLSRCELFFNHKICLQNKTFSPSLYRKISPSGLPRRNCQGHGHVGTCPWREVHKVITLTSFCEKMWKHTHNEAFCLDKLAPGMNEESLGWRLPCEWVLTKLCFQLQTLDKGNITDYSDFKLFSWLKKTKKPHNFIALNLKVNENSHEYSSLEYLKLWFCVQFSAPGKR